MVASCIPATSAVPPEPPPTTASGSRLDRNGDAVVLSATGQHNYVLEFGPYALEVDPVDGGRIVGFSLSGKGVLQTRDQSHDAYGSSFWPSPQSDWTWPPPIELDKNEWKAKAEGTALFLESGTNRALGLSASQRIEADPRREAFLIEFGLTNRGDAPRRVAPWQNTRCRPKGLTFFPSAAPTLPKSAFMLEPQDGVIWYRHDPSAGRKGKLFADGAEGWLAHVDGDLVFVKVFPDVVREHQGPGEADIELYIDPSGQFVEVEQQGAYVEIAPGATSLWSVRWLVRKVPEAVSAEPGSAKLLQFVRSVAAASGA